MFTSFAFFFLSFSLVGLFLFVCTSGLCVAAFPLAELLASMAELSLFGSFALSVCTCVFCSFSVLCGRIVFAGFSEREFCLKFVLFEK
jgi:hypothetical protein